MRPCPTLGKNATLIEEARAGQLREKQTVLRAITTITIFAYPFGH
jgi:hypothetical protein